MVVQYPFADRMVEPDLYRGNICLRLSSVWFQSIADLNRLSRFSLFFLSTGATPDEPFLSGTSDYVEDLDLIGAPADSAEAFSSST